MLGICVQSQIFFSWWVYMSRVCYLCSWFTRQRGVKCNVVWQPELEHTVCLQIVFIVRGSLVVGYICIHPRADEPVTLWWRDRQSCSDELALELKFCLWFLFSPVSSEIEVQCVVVIPVGIARDRFWRPKHKQASSGRPQSTLLGAL
jgi:hypothetical protein